MNNEWVSVGGMRIVKGNKCTWRKPAPVQYCPLHIPNDYKYKTMKLAIMRWLKASVQELDNNHIFGIKL
jgi:hypothetical protein